MGKARACARQPISGLDFLSFLYHYEYINYSFSTTLFFERSFSCFLRLRYLLVFLHLDSILSFASILAIAFRR